MRCTSALLTLSLFFLISPQAGILSAAAETMHDCVVREWRRDFPNREVRILDGEGCKSGETDINGRKTCRKNLCWESPPNHIILDSRHSKNSCIGSCSHSGPEYLPTRDAATKICFSVHARSPSSYGSRGSITLNAFATTQKNPTIVEMAAYASRCAAQGAR